MIAAITSCTNTSNPGVMLAAGLVAQKAVAKGLTRKPWVKTSLAPGSQVVEDYLKAAGVQTSLDALGFNLAGFGCTTCIGNSGPLDEPIVEAVEDNGLVVAAVLSGNRNFEGRISPQVKANYLASPPLVVAYAIAGTMNLDLATEPLGIGKDGKPVFLKDIWPTNAEIKAAMEKNVTREMYRQRYANVFEGPAQWQRGQVPLGPDLQMGRSLDLCEESALFRRPDQGAAQGFSDIRNARLLAHARRFDHDRPYQPGRQHQIVEPGRPIPGQHTGAAGRFQLLWSAARQRRCDDARHLRQCAHQERDGGRRRGRRDPLQAAGRSDCRSTTRRSNTRPRGFRWS